MRINVLEMSLTDGLGVGELYFTCLFHVQIATTNTNMQFRRKVIMLMPGGPKKCKWGYPDEACPDERFVCSLQY